VRVFSLEQFVPNSFIPQTCHCVIFSVLGLGALNRKSISDLRKNHGTRVHCVSALYCITERGQPLVMVRNVVTVSV